jgi:hypothetical protein
LPEELEGFTACEPFEPEVGQLRLERLSLVHEPVDVVVELGLQQLQRMVRREPPAGTTSRGSRQIPWSRVLT